MIALTLPEGPSCERGTLDDGTRIALRPIKPADAPLLREGMRRLSERTRYLRFHTPRVEFDAGELRFLTEVDGESHFALVAFALRPRRPIAVGRFFRSGPSAADAEIALVVEDSMQGKGLGALLLSRLRDAAIARGIRRFTGVMLDENHVMRQLWRKAGGRVGIASWGVCEVELRLA